MEQTLRLIVLPTAPRVAGPLPTVLAVLAIWRRRSRTRRQLAALEACALADIGLTRAQQRAEAGKWFWQV
ncbi:MAG: DUF1127 domain-containing protein [Reyranella sp.]|uniref:DUF1127 domain-containing protein n=1 Tax=Reyranella sp. TaxID=1929291 RepID=UPI0027311F67|nr:DUF1127 domain-containing protein [Reyranella sp.]MDP1965248.1 DUF1127 domain-containing protein [Reyranella sp.]MDP2376134.1 DUF1127 domain-containing protein [Reyranella sp.]